MTVRGHSDTGTGIPEVDALIADERLLIPGELHMFEGMASTRGNDGRGLYLTAEGRLIEPGSIT